MSISRLIQAKSVIAEPFLVVTNELHFSKSTGRTEAGVLSDKVIVPKNIQGTPGTGQHDTHFSGMTKVVFSVWGSKFYFSNSRTGESDPENEKNMCRLKRRLLETRLSVRS